LADQLGEVVRLPAGGGVGNTIGINVGLVVGAWVLSIVGETVSSIEGATVEFSVGVSFGLPDGDLVAMPLDCRGDDTVGRLLVLSAGDLLGEFQKMVGKQLEIQFDFQLERTSGRRSWCISWQFSLIFR
jgi:hypothetical protein